jgi:hypothetical protein
MIFFLTSKLRFCDQRVLHGIYAPFFVGNQRRRPWFSFTVQRPCNSISYRGCRSSSSHPFHFHAIFLLFPSEWTSSINTADDKGGTTNGNVPAPARESSSFFYFHETPSSSTRGRTCWCRQTSSSSSSSSLLLVRALRLVHVFEPLYVRVYLYHTSFLADYTRLDILSSCSFFVGNFLLRRN